MSDFRKNLTEYLTNSEIALVELQGQGYTFLDSSFIWQILSYELEHWDIPTEVLFHKLSAQEIISTTKKYFADNGLPMKNIALDKSIIPKELSNDLIKAQIKFKGEIWTIHKNDKDTFPSQPHAHNYERQYKLHLGNGKLYRKKNLIDTIRNKDLVDFRRIITQNLKIILPIYENN
jgi:hypothetical protein